MHFGIGCQSLIDEINGESELKIAIIDLSGSECVTGMDNHIIQLFNGLIRSDLGQPCLSRTGIHWIPLDLRSDHVQPTWHPLGSI